MRQGVDNDTALARLRARRTEPVTTATFLAFTSAVSQQSPGTRTSTIPQLAFFPWIELECDIDVGGYSLKRFKRERLPEADVESRATLDSVLAPYRDLLGHPVKTAVILTAHGRGLTDDLSGQNRADLFLFAELFAFAALAAREFFSGDYFTRDHLRLAIQAFTDPQGGASMEMRRRDGVQWSSVTGDYYRVQVPAHVSPGGQLIKPDLDLLNALLELRERLESRAWSGLYQGIVLFNQANSDAPDMSPDTELVLTCSAIEQVLGITSRQDQRQFPAKFAEAWHPDREVPQSEWQEPPTNRPWTEDTLRACWASDLKICRGNLAHGHPEYALQSPWTVRQHLLLTSFIVPLLVKQVLSEMDVYTLTDEDERDINALEPLLNLPDVFAPPCPEDDEVGFPSEDYTWRSVLRREHVRHLRYPGGSKR